jgi:hypothetical protein
VAVKQEVQSERTWLALAVSFLLGGATLIATADTPKLCDPFFYVGLTFCVIALWVFFGVFVTPKVLPKLPSERAAEQISKLRDASVVIGDELYGRPVASDTEFARYKIDYTRWVLDTAGWLGQEVSGAKASEFQHATGMAADIIGSFNRGHSNLRLRVSWQLQILRRLEP